MNEQRIFHDWEEEKEERDDELEKMLKEEFGEENYAEKMERLKKEKDPELVN